MENQISLEEIRNYRMQCLQIARQFQDEDSCVHILSEDAEFLFRWIYAFELTGQTQEPEINSNPEEN